MERLKACISKHTRGKERRARGLKMAVVIAAVVVVLRYLPATGDSLLFSVVENSAYDIAVTTMAPRPPRDIAIVGIDRQSMRPDRLGRFPWSRARFAELLHQLREAHVVALDVVFAGANAGDREGDELFAEAIADHGRVVLASYVGDAVDGVVSEMPSPTLYPMPEGGVRPAARVAPSEFVMPEARFARNAAGVAPVNLSTDSDGIHRRVRLFREGPGEAVWPHFCVETARVALGLPLDGFLTGLSPDDALLGESDISLDGNGEMLVDYCGPSGTIPCYRFYQVLNGHVPPHTFADKVVFVGAVAPEQADVHPTPYDGQSHFLLGVEINANILKTILHGQARRDLTQSPPVLLLAFLLGALCAWVVWWFRGNAGPLAGAAIVLVVVLPSYFVAFKYFNCIIPYGAFLLASIIPMGLEMLDRTETERDLVRSDFSSYVSPQVLTRLTRDPELVHAGENRVVTVLFVDIRDSVGLAERLEPREWLEQVNEYMTAMTAIVLDYDGYLDKYLGDGMMAIWNAFGQQEDHAELGARAALKMVERVAELGRQWEGRPDRVVLQTGAGISSGEAIVGEAGSRQRCQYTAMGDTVNVAARIQELTKRMDAKVLVSAATGALLPPDMPRRSRGMNEIRGRSRPIEIIELLDRQTAAPEHTALESAKPSVAGNTCDTEPVARTGT